MRRGVKILFLELFVLILLSVFYFANIKYNFYDLSPVFNILTNFISSKFWILVLAFLFLVFLFLSYMKVQKLKAQRVSKIVKLSFQRKSGKGFTDLDAFYDLLVKEKSINIPSIARTFKIDKDLALEWSKIFEDLNLAAIEYPTFSDPIVNIVEDNKDKGNEETNEKQKETNEKKSKEKQREKPENRKTKQEKKRQSKGKFRNKKISGKRR